MPSGARASLKYLVAKLGTTAPPWLKAERRDLLTEEL
jgi:hypothetical protein